MEHYKKRLIRCQTSDNFRLKPSNEPRQEGDQENEKGLPDVFDSNGVITTAENTERKAMRQRKIAKKRAVCRNKFRHTDMELFKLGTGKPTSLCKTKQSYQLYTEKSQPSDHNKPKEPKETITELIISSIEGKKKDLVRSKSTDTSNKPLGRHSLPQLVPEMPLKKKVRFSSSDVNPRQTVTKRRKTVTGTESYQQPASQSDTTSDCESEPNLKTTADSTNSDDGSIENLASQNDTQPQSVTLQAVRSNVFDSVHAIDEKESRIDLLRNGGIYKTVHSGSLDNCAQVQRSYRSQNGWTHETIKPVDAGYPTNEQPRSMHPENLLGRFPPVDHNEKQKLRLKGHVDYKERLRVFFAQNRKPQTKPPLENEQQRNQPINLSVKQPSKPDVIPQPAFIFPEITEQISRLGDNPNNRLVKAAKNERKVDYLINYTLDIAKAAMTLPFSIGNLLIMNEKYRELQSYLAKPCISKNVKLTLTATMNKMVSYVCYKIFGDSTNTHLRWYTEQLLNSSLEHHRSELENFILSFSYGGTKDENWFREFLSWIRFISRKTVDVTLRSPDKCVPHNVPRVPTSPNFMPHNQYKPYMDRDRQFTVPSSNRHAPSNPHAATDTLPYPNQQFLVSSPSYLTHFSSPPTVSNTQQLPPNPIPSQFSIKLANTMPYTNTQLPSPNTMLPLFSLKIGDMRPCADPQCQTMSPKSSTSNPPPPAEFPMKIALPEGQTLSTTTSLNPLYSTVGAKMNPNPQLPIHFPYGPREVESGTVESNCKDKEHISGASMPIENEPSREKQSSLTGENVIAENHVTKSVIVKDKSMEITKGGQLLKERTTNGGEDEVILEKIEYSSAARNRVEKAREMRTVETDPDDFDASPDFQLFKEILIEEDKDVYKKVLKKLMRVKEDTKRPAVILIDDEEDNSIRKVPTRVEKPPIDLTKEKTQPFLIDLTNTSSKSNTGEKCEPPRKKIKKNKPFRIFKEILVIDDDETTKTMQIDENQNCIEKIRYDKETFHPAIEDISSDAESLSTPQQIANGSIHNITPENIDIASREIKRKTIASSPEKWNSRHEIKHQDIKSVPAQYEKQEARRDNIHPNTISERINDRSPNTESNNNNVATIKTLENGFLSGQLDVKPRRDIIISPKTARDNEENMAEHGTKESETQEINKAQQNDLNFVLPSTTATKEVACKHTTEEYDSKKTYNHYSIQDREEPTQNPSTSTNDNETKETNNVTVIPMEETNNNTIKTTFDAISADRHQQPAEEPRRKSIISPPITKTHSDTTTKGKKPNELEPPPTDNSVDDAPTVLVQAKPVEPQPLPANGIPRRYSLISPPLTQPALLHQSQQKNGLARQDSTEGREKETVIVHTRPSVRQDSRCASAGSKEDSRSRGDTLNHKGYPSPPFSRSLSVPVVWNPWLSQSKGFPSSRRQSVETISNAGSDYSPNVVPEATTFEIRLDSKWYRISKNLYDKIPKGKLRWMKEKNSFVRYCDGNQMEQFVENTTDEQNGDDLRRVKTPARQSLYLGAVNTGEVIEIAQDVVFSSEPFVSEPETFSEEVSKVEKFIPSDFFGFYVYVTGFQIVNGNPPISFHTFLMMHNTNRTLMLLKKYIYNLLTTGEVDFSFTNQES